METTQKPTVGGVEQVARDRGLFVSSHVPHVPTGTVLLTPAVDSWRQYAEDAAMGRVLRDRGLATLSIRLLSPEEEADENRRRYLRFEAELLAERLEAMVNWLRAVPGMTELKLGLMASTTDAAAAALTAARRPDAIAALVLCAAVLDEVEPSLPLVKAPTLLVAGERDLPILAMSEEALDLFGGESDMAVIEQASHGFPESGAMEEVSRIAGDWFLLHLVQPALVPIEW